MLALAVTYECDRSCTQRHQKKRNVVNNVNLTPHEVSGVTMVIVCKERIGTSRLRYTFSINTEISLTSVELDFEVKDGTTIPRKMETVSSPKAVFKVGSGSQRQAMVVVIAEENNKIVTNDLTIIMIMVEVGEGDFMLLASLQPIFENNGQ